MRDTNIPQCGIFCPEETVPDTGKNAQFIQGR